MVNSQQHWIQDCRIPTISSEQASYIAGITDGEGTITIAFRDSNNDGRTYTIPIVSISNTNPRLFDWLKTVLGERVLLYSAPVPGRKPRMTLQISAILDVQKLLTQILPYLILKKRQAELLLEYCKLRREARIGDDRSQDIKIAEEVRALNKRGV